MLAVSRARSMSGLHQWSVTWQRNEKAANGGDAPPAAFETQRRVMAALLSPYNSRVRSWFHWRE